MKTITNLLFVFMILGITTSCLSQENKKETTTTANLENEQFAQSKKVEVYYFHYTRRCATCNAVENVTKETIKENYGSSVIFSDINLDEKSGEAKGKELDISGQTLLIVSGDTKINLTNEGFMNARANPDKLKQILKENIDPLL